MWKEIWSQLKFEVKSEWKGRNTFYSILLYLVAAVYVSFLAFLKIENDMWAALFWIIIMFIATNAISKSFIQSSKGRLLYNASLVSPQALILSKMIYNALLMCILSSITLLFFSVFLGLPIQNFSQFFLAIVLGSIGIAGSLTMTSAISFRASNQIGLMAILSFPLILPVLTMELKLTKFAIDGINGAIVNKNIFALTAIDSIMLTLAYLLFPYLWTE